MLKHTYKHMNSFDSFNKETKDAQIQNFTKMKQ